MDVLVSWQNLAVFAFDRPFFLSSFLIVMFKFVLCADGHELWDTYLSAISHVPLLLQFFPSDA